jgi:hypothetical protein
MYLRNGRKIRRALNAARNMNQQCQNWGYHCGNYEEGGTRFLRNFGTYLPNCMASHKTSESSTNKFKKCFKCELNFILTVRVFG